MKVGATDFSPMVDMDVDNMVNFFENISSTILSVFKNSQAYKVGIAASSAHIKLFRSRHISYLHGK